MISEERGSLTTEESIKIPLKALADHSLSVRKTALQDIRNILHQHRSWLGGLLPANTHADGTSTPGQHAVLLSSLLGALLKCCDPEVLLCSCRRTLVSAHILAVRFLGAIAVSKRPCCLFLFAASIGSGARTSCKL